MTIANICDIFCGLQKLVELLAIFFANRKKYRKKKRKKLMAPIWFYLNFLDTYSEIVLNPNIQRLGSIFCKILGRGIEKSSFIFCENILQVKWHGLYRVTANQHDIAILPGTNRCLMRIIQESRKVHNMSVEEILSCLKI